MQILFLFFPHSHQCFYELIHKANAAAILYISYIKQGSIQIIYSCSSWWILDHNNKRVGVSALHLLDDAILNSIQLYISKSEEEREVDMLSAFESFSMKNALESKFIKITLRQDLLVERVKWIKENENNLEFMQQHALDPEFGLQPHPTVDILFTSVPDELNGIPGFMIAKAPTCEGSVFGHIAFHNEREPTEPGLYNETIQHPPKARELLFAGRSLSLGRVVKSSSILTVISTNAEGSSGGCMVDDDLGVFAISCSSFFDDPTVDEEEEKQPTEPLMYDVDVLEKGEPNARAPRNRNLALSLFHPAVKALLEKL